VSDWPSVGVVMPTHNRPELLRKAMASVLAQDYPGELRVLVVFDRNEPDESLRDGSRVEVTANSRTPGLAGARNTGIEAMATDLIAFCDDDDEWLPGKLAAQVEALRTHPDAVLASCGIAVDYDGTTTDRLAGADQVTHAELVRSRMVMVHSSTYLARRAALLEIGMVDERIPGSQGEDWDLALRAARRHPIVHVDRPLVRILWGGTSYFAQAWETKIAALRYLLDQHPEIERSSVGAARVYGQLAFGHACLGQRSDAWRWSKRAWRANWRERRVPFALAVAARVVSGERVMRTLHTRGRGI
jgi:glycosyltransferase involved in cell wall biosynthesis